MSLGLSTLTLATVAAAVSSMGAQMSAMSSYDSANDPFTFGAATTALSAMSKSFLTFTTMLSVRYTRRSPLIATNATGWPIALVGVPQYNFDDCFLDETLGRSITTLIVKEL